MCKRNRYATGFFLTIVQEFSGGKLKRGSLTVVGGKLILSERFKLYPHFLEGTQVVMPNHVHFGYNCKATNADINGTFFFF